MVWVHAPFSAGRFEGPEEKVRRLDAVDYYVTGPLRAILLKHRPSRMCLIAAGLRHRGLPEKGRAPFVLWGEGVSTDTVKAWNESDALAGALGCPKLTRLLDLFRD